MTDLDAVFGAQRRDARTWAPVIVIRHGFIGGPEPFRPLEKFLQATFGAAQIDNRSYDWRRSVLYSGAELAQTLLTNEGYAGRDLVLIGHGMGGLVCRICNCVLRDPSFSQLMTWLPMQLGYSGREVQEIEQFNFGPASIRPVCGLVTLAAPNGGALLQGQVSGIAGLAPKAVNTFFPTRISSVADLTTDRVFNILQHLSVDTKTLSVSGSRRSRSAIASGQVANWLGRGGIQLDVPHDSVVEDRSVDLTQSVLPNEIVHHGKSPYMHLRAYRDCTSVSHTSIYDHSGVRELLVEFLLRC